MSEFLTTSNAAAAPAITVSVIPPIPAAPAIILYDQTDNPAPTPPPPPSNGVITSQDYEPKFDNYDSFAADDFVVPPGQIWNITEVDVIGESSEPPALPDSFHVFFYADSGTLPGTLVASRLANPYSVFTFVIALTSPVSLAEGTYWVSVQAREDFTSSGEWFWGNRLVTSNSGAAWQNPGGGFGTNCPTWGRKTTCRPTQNGPDQLFRLGGTLIAIPPDAAEDYANAQAASDAGATPVVRRCIGTDGSHLIAGRQFSRRREGAAYNRAIAAAATATSFKPFSINVATAQFSVNQTVDLASYVGQIIHVKFLVHQDGSGAFTGMFVDDVQLTLPCGSISPTPAPRTTVARPRPTPRQRP